MTDAVSIARLSTLQPIMQRIVSRASAHFEAENPGFVRVTQGKRTVAQQAVFVEQGASETMASAHLTGEAVDLVVIDKVAQYRAGLARLLNVYMQQAATNEGVVLVWGGTWPHLQDFFHWELAARYRVKRLLPAPVPIGQSEGK